MTAREEAFRSSSILSGFRKTGIFPFSTITVLSTLEMPPPSRNPPTPDWTLSALETTLLVSLPSKETDIRKANEELLEIAQKTTEIPSPTKRYIRRLTSTLETSNSERVLLRKENNAIRDLLRVRKERKKGKRVAIKGKFVFNTREILEVVEKAEAEASTKKTKRKRTANSTTPRIEEEEEEVREILSEESGGGCIVVIQRR